MRSSLPLPNLQSGQATRLSPNLHTTSTLEYTCIKRLPTSLPLHAHIPTLLPPLSNSRPRGSSLHSPPPLLSYGARIHRRSVPRPSVPPFATNPPTSPPPYCLPRSPPSPARKSARVRPRAALCRPSFRLPPARQPEPPPSGRGPIRGRFRSLLRRRRRLRLWNRRQFWRRWPRRQWQRRLGRISR
ncbi:unnamed protein product [Chondrus crispus]|uniref:Uncharacterized protein n=1 Tax=Chondrus crispus TaxID=2769 RepID=R7Q551_CHOCR|nr:unnamed protein product [Chondrus crispus]CDF33154.1 unnamed protein product [Chondrus crispus]|eukprot:XP_005712957.1 unnamed protein product [Chondrus crispus]